MRLLLRAFFHRIEVSGQGNVPAGGGGILVAWHPNGLVDPALILASFPRRVVFGARHGLFKVPVLGELMRAIGTVPIYRAQDQAGASEEARREANRCSLDALATAVAAGSFASLFPEGVSHDDPRPRELRPGVARLYYRARQLTPAGETPPAIIPVGLHYDHKHVYRSRALVRFHEPLQLPAELAVTPPEDETPEQGKARVTQLMQLIDVTLQEAAGATEDWRLHFTLHRARKLIRAERAARAGAAPGQPDMLERVIGFDRVRTACLVRQKSHPREATELRRRVSEYDADLAALGVEDHDLDRNPRWGSPWLALLLLLQVLGVFFLLPPFVVVGMVINGPAVVVLDLFARFSAPKIKDKASMKLLGGIVLFPLVWTSVGLLAVLSRPALASTRLPLPEHPVLVFGLTVALAIVGGMVALRYLRLWRETMRALRVRFTRRLRRASIQRLRSERAAICDQLLALGEGLDLPGTVRPDGRIH